MRTILFAALIVALGEVWCASCHAEVWQVGTARINITPEKLMWMSGYNRDKPAQGTLSDLWAKAIILEAADRQRVVLVTMDLIGIERELSRSVCQRIETLFKIPRSSIVLTVSHTHTGPVVGENLRAMYTLDDEQQKLVDTYAGTLADKLVNLVALAIENIQPAALSWGTGTATFAVNRRNNSEERLTQLRLEGKLVGPVDHDVPVLAVRSLDGQLKAIVCGYACHATVLDFYQWSGDWPGFAQSELEERHPGSIALFWAGCGGDQNPLPRRSISLAQCYGHELAEAVDDVLKAPMSTLNPRLSTVYKEIDLPFADLPSREELEKEAARDDFTGRCKQFLLRKWNREGTVSPTYPYPIQLWAIDNTLSWAFLGGEVVVDYSLELKRSLGSKNTWVTAYANDVMAYVPSQRVLREGSYEGRDSMDVYGLPAPWSPKIETMILGQMKEFSTSYANGTH